MNLFELFVKIGVDDQASGKLSDLSSKLGNGLKTAAKIGTAAVGAAAAGITALTTAAVNNYAEYEQLVGGVETLFKNSANKVQEYAANAYKTAGMSANEYMETVTSFSASLLQSLDGDTNAAAEKANLAITDMSDNANKMGTDMELIQNAYRGFAKSNYTMLDNLALGYGGTKEEMQRLLDDAEKLSGQKFDISSYGDIVDAIHVVQTEMGITGTTALEAGRTISGSVGAMKSAWTNLITGLADGNADIGKLVDNLVTTIVGDGTENNLGVLGNVMPAVKTALSGASRLVSELLPKIVQEIPSIINENLPVLAEAAISIIQSLVDGISQNQETLFGTIFDLIAYLSESFLSMLPEIVKLGLDLIISLADGIAKNLPEIIPAVVDVIIKIAEVLTEPESIAKMITAALTLILALSDGMIKAVPELIKSIPKIVSSVFNAFQSNSSTFLDIGKQIVKGVWSGISSMIKWFTDKVKGFFSGIVDGVKDTLGIHSPSKVFAGIGGFMAEGLADGWDKEYNGIKRSIEKDLNFGTATVDFDSSALSKKHSGIEGAFSGIANSAGENITIVVQSVLDGRIIGETSYKYIQGRARAYGT